MACSSALLSLFGTVNGCSKKQKKALDQAALVAGT